MRTWLDSSRGCDRRASRRGPGPNGSSWWSLYWPSANGRESMARRPTSHTTPRSLSPACALGVGEVTAILAGYVLLGRLLGIRGRPASPRASLGGLAAMALACDRYRRTHCDRGGEAAATPWTAQSCQAVVVDRAVRRARSCRRRRLVPRMKEAFAAPGLQMAVAVDGKARLVRGLRVRRMWPDEAGKAARTTLFRIGSVSKPFTSTALARLFQAGRWSSTPGPTARPACRGKVDAVTLRQLAAHQGGRSPLRRAQRRSGARTTGAWRRRSRCSQPIPSCSSRARTSSTRATAST